MSPRVVIPTHDGYVPPEDLRMNGTGDVQVRGQYKVLNLAGYQIYPGTLYASGVTTADIAILSGAYVPNGIDFSWLAVYGRFHSQAVLAKDFDLGHVEGDVDISASKIERMLKLNGMSSRIALRMADGLFGTVDFGDTYRDLRLFDVRGATISRVEGDWPAEIHEILRDERTKIPDDFLAYLKERELR